MAAITQSLDTAGHYALHAAKAGGSCALANSDTPLLCTIRSLLPKYLYDTTKYSAELAGSWSYWGGKQITTVCDEIVKSLGMRNVNLYQNVAKLTHQIGATINQADQHLLNNIAPELPEKSAEILNENAFKLRDLIGPTLFITFCAQQTMKNATNAKRHLTMLCKGKLSETVQYQPSSPNGVGFQHTTTYSLRKLTWFALLDSVSTVAWAAGGYLTKIGMAEAMEESGIEASKTHMIANAVVLTAIAAPKLMNLAYTKVIKPACNFIAEWQNTNSTKCPIDLTNIDTRQSLVYGIDKDGNLTKTLINVPNVDD